MKYLLLCAFVLGLNSCNTSIGVYRDVKHAYYWTKGKIQSANGGNSADDSGAPVY